MKSKDILLFTMFLSMAAFSFSAASFVQASKCNAVIKRFVSDIQIMDIEPDGVGK